MMKNRVLEYWSIGGLVWVCLLTSVYCLAAPPVSRWDFNGNLNDSLGQVRDNLSALHGSARYASEKELPGVEGQALVLGVEDGDARSLTAGSSADVALGPDYTIEAWILPTEISRGWHRLVLNWGADHSYHFAIRDSMVSLYHGQEDGRECFAEGGKVRINRWNHIVGVARRNEDDPTRSTIEVYLNGRLEASVAYDGTIRSAGKQGIGIGDDAGGRSTIKYRGYIDSISIWNESLTAEEILKRASARQKAIDMPSPPITHLKNTLKNKDPLVVAVTLEKTARERDLDDEAMEIAAGLLDHKDLFVRAMAEWAIARKVGRDNNHENVVWTEKSDAGWFRKWLKIPMSERVEMDWCRQAVSLGIYNNAEKLKAGIEKLDALTGRSLDFARDDINSDDIKKLRALWVGARRANRARVFRKAKLDFDEIILYNRFALHYKPNVCGVHTSWSYKPGGDIVVVSGLEKHEREEPLLNDKLGAGHVHGIDLSFDRKKVVFSWAPQPEWPPRFSTRWPRKGNDCFAFELRNTTIPPHLYELDIRVGEITQLTDHNFWTDIEPLYCPDGTIAFTSDRSAHSPSCDGAMNDLTDHNLYSLSADRRSIRRLTNQKDVDMHPHLLDNGLIAYLRWEYQERHFWDVHSVWTVKPDGTMSDAAFKQHLGAPLSVRDARSVPGTGKLVAIAAGHHTLPKGPVVILNPSAGVNEQEGIEILTVGSRPQELSRFNWERKWDRQVVDGGGVQVAGGFFMMPYALSENTYLVSYGYGNREASRHNFTNGDVDSNGLGVYLIDADGSMELIYRHPLYSSYSVLPFQKRRKPPVLPDMVDMTRNYATCVIPDVYEGMEGVERGIVKYIRISEALPWPIVPGEGVKRWDLSNRWCPVRVIGTVPVEDDGSAHFKVPVADNASVYFQALDAKHMEVRRMRSSISFQPGERRSCNGCHETRAISPGREQGKAVRRAADMPKVPEWGSNRQLGIDLVQPVLDKNCVSCHAGGKLNLTAGKAWQAIKKSNLVSLSPMHGDGSVTQPYQYGSHKSRLITQLLRKDTPCNTQMSDAEWVRLVTWVDANAPNSHLMNSKRTADGKNWQWEKYDWRDPWSQPEEVPAMGEYIDLPDNRWRRALSSQNVQK